MLRVTDVSPGMRRVTLGGPALRAHVAENGYPVAAFRSDGFDDEFKLFMRHPDVVEAVGPTQADGVLNWPRDPHLLTRTYTVRRWDAERGEVDVEVVRHGRVRRRPGCLGCNPGIRSRSLGRRCRRGIRATPIGC